MTNTEIRESQIRWFIAAIKTLGYDVYGRVQYDDTGYPWHDANLIIATKEGDKFCRWHYDNRVYLATCPKNPIYSLILNDQDIYAYMEIEKLDMYIKDAFNAKQKALWANQNKEYREAVIETCKDVQEYMRGRESLAYYHYYKV